MIVDCTTFILMYLNPFLLETKFEAVDAMLVKNLWVCSYQNFSRNDCRGLVSVQFFAALITFLGGNMEFSKNAMIEPFGNLSMQPLSKKNGKILLGFENLVANINLLLRIRTDFLNEQKGEK